MGGTQPCAKLKERLLVDKLGLSIAVFASLASVARIDESEFVAELCDASVQQELLLRCLKVCHHNCSDCRTMQSS